MFVFRDDNYWLVDDVMWSDCECWESFVIQGVDKIRYYGYCYGMFFFVWPVSFYHASKDSFQLQLKDMTYRKNGWNRRLNSSCFSLNFLIAIFWVLGKTTQKTHNPLWFYRCRMKVQCFLAAFWTTFQRLDRFRDVRRSRHRKNMVNDMFGEFSSFYGFAWLMILSKTFWKKRPIEDEEILLTSWLYYKITN